MVIAIDGPAASGKSTTAKLVARRLGYTHVDTGAMYRAVTLKVLRSGIDPLDEQSIRLLLESTRVALEDHGGTLGVFLDDENVTEEIRTPEVTTAVSSVSSLRSVREGMVREQRRMGEKGGIVLEGRDIGTVVFPDADLKFFVVASIVERARRRLQELRQKGIQARLIDLERELQERDRIDSTRPESPLQRAPDAIEVDTSSMTVAQQVELVVEMVRRKQEEGEKG
ncbi:MAG: (d)CMP kinase [Bacteroidetes bacterium]|nr:(d)CMP kinase [Bacteroidota bacterium]